MSTDLLELLDALSHEVHDRGVRHRESQRDQEDLDARVGVADVSGCVLHSLKSR